MGVEQRVREAFKTQYGTPPSLVVRAPGRVNLIGEHTDYNDGFVLPAAINRAAWIALRPVRGRTVRLRSLDFDEECVLDLDALTHGSGWTEYPRGVAWALTEAGYELQGWEGVAAGDVPIGAGLSSSAALELATARAFAAVSDLPWQPAAMARIAQRAENAWVGVNCGIMDQMISAAGVAEHALLIDCRTLESRPVPLPADHAIVIMDSGTRRGLVESAYNERRERCEAAARHFRVPALRDLGPERLQQEGDGLDPVTFRRARHVVTENARTLAAAAALQEGRLDEVGHLFDASHRSMRDDFEITTPILDTLVRIARATEGCLGARMTGGGFGGCAVALVTAEQAPAFARLVADDYAKQVGETATIYITRATDGAAVVGG